MQKKDESYETSKLHNNSKYSKKHSENYKQFHNHSLLTGLVHVYKNEDLNVLQLYLLMQRSELQWGNRKPKQFREGDSISCIWKPERLGVIQKKSLVLWGSAGPNKRNYQEARDWPCKSRIIESRAEMENDRKLLYLRGRTRLPMILGKDC